MRKGIVSQVFIYIFVVIVMAMIIFFGFKQIVNLDNLQEKSNYVTFKTDFENAVDDIYYKNPGSKMVFSMSSRNKPLDLPKNVEQVCFNGEEVSFKPDKIYSNFNVEHLSSLGGNSCFDVIDGRLSFELVNRAEGEVTYVDVSSVGT